MKIDDIKDFDVAVIGAGAAGLMCAIEAGKRARRVCLIEHNDSVGKKIRISGGGRCNFTNTFARSENYLGANEHFPKSALARFTSGDFCQLVEKYNIAYHEKKLGQLFCDKSAQEIIDLLLAECGIYNVEILLQTKINKVNKTQQFHLSTNNGPITADSLVVATGGLSIPSLGVSDLGYNIARQFGLKVTPLRAGLVPFVLNVHDLDLFKALSGVSLDVEVTFKKSTFRENLLFTHKGLSGPAILQISSYWEPAQPLSINLLPEKNALEILTYNAKKKISFSTLLAQYFPKRFAEVFATNYLPQKLLNQCTPHELKRAAQSIHQWEITPKETEGYLKAEVTVGGVDTCELSSKTMEARKVPDLYFIGEVVDVTGHLGGFNFQWAWASGYAAGQFV